MARKKKQIEELPAVVGDSVATSTVKQSLAQAASYQGGVQITLYKRKTPVRSHRYKNQGGKPLFDFLARCLGSRYQEAEALRPHYVQLFHVEDPTQAANILRSNQALRRSSKVLYKSAPVISDASIDNLSATTTMEFMIPFTQIAASEGSSDINLAALYATEDASQDRYCAFVILKPEETQPSGNSADYNLFIKWDLTVSNK